MGIVRLNRQSPSKLTSEWLEQEIVINSVKFDEQRVILRDANISLDRAQKARDLEYRDGVEFVSAAFIALDLQCDLWADRVETARAARAALRDRLEALQYEQQVKRPARDKHSQ